MKVHRHIGHAFAAFCAFLVSWHSTTPNNPQHDIAMWSMSIWAILYLISAWSSVLVARVIQTGTLLMGAFLTVHFGNLPIASLIIVISVLVYWGYGEFHQFNPVEAASVFSVVFAVFFLGILTAGSGYGQAYLIAFVWSGAIALGFWVAWRLFLLFADKIMKHNRELNEQNHDLNEVNKKLLGELHGRRR